MLFKIAILVFLSLSQWAQGSILVLEYDDHSADGHENYVQYAACQEQTENCQVLLFDALGSEPHHQKILELVPQHQVVNMSFGFQFEERPRERRGEEGEVFLQRLEDNAVFNESVETESKFLQNLIAGHPNVNFVAASGNGRALGVMYTKGVFVSPKRELIPATLPGGNLLTVSATNSTAGMHVPIDDIELADYANYSLWHVDVASPVAAVNREGLIFRGTSFAAPYSSSIIDQIRYTYPEITATEANEIVMKSVDVKHIDAAIAATQDLILAEQEGRESIVWQAMTHRERKVRLQLQQQIGDILLVKSGGVVNAKRALACAKSFSENEFRQLEKACLDAHRVSGNRDEDKLLELWRLREL